MSHTLGADEVADAVFADPWEASGAGAELGPGGS